MSGFYYSMFKPRCLVFPFQWLKGQSGLCLAPSHLPSHLPVREGVVPCAAYLRSRYGICCPFCFDRTAMMVEMRAGSVTTHWRLTVRRPIVLDVYARGFVENTAWALGDIISPVLFSRWRSAGPARSPPSISSCTVYHYTSSVLSFLSKNKASGKNQMCFTFWRKGR